MLITPQLKSHANLFEADAENEDGEVEEEHPEMDTYSAAGWLVIITVITAFCADVLVGSIDETATKWKLPKPYMSYSLESPTARLTITTNMTQIYRTDFVAHRRKRR